MTDSRSFIISTVEHYFDISEVKIPEKSENSLAEFIHNPQQLQIQVSVINGNVLQVLTEVKTNAQKSLVFYKTSARDLTTENAEKHVNMITLSGAPAESLYHVLRQVYAPLLVLDNDLISSKLQQNLTDLESNLRILTHNKQDLLNFNVILSISDEIEYWKNIKQKKDVSKKEIEAASSLSEIFEDINEEIRTMQSLGVSEIREATENIGGLLDDVWRLTTFTYSQDRMKHIFDIIGHSVCSIIQKILSSVDIWQVHSGTKDNDILAMLSGSLNVVQTWTNACHSLTKTFWPNYALHPWTGKPYVPKFSMNFEERIREIHDIRFTHNQLNKLLSNTERQELQIDKMFEPFKSVNEWICVGPNQAWETAVARFTGNIKPAEAKIADKLKPRLHNTSTKQMLYEFMRYKMLLERPVVKSALHTELETFVSSLGSMLKVVQSQLDGGDAADVSMYQPPEMSTTLQQVQWAKQMEGKVMDIQTIADKHLNEFECSSEVSNLAAQVLKDLKNMYTQLHEDWSRDLQAQLKSGSLQLSPDKPVVEFSASNNMMVVHYNPGVVALSVEARGMAALGMPAPAQVTEALVHLSRQLHHARLLNQVASFHNTMGERMIPSTRPMMLQAALDLSSLVQDQKAVYWDNEDQVANYTDKLKKAVLKLETQNSYLTSQHVAIRNVVASLMDTELLAKQPEWKKKIKEIRDIIEKVEINGYKNTDLWRTHWDWQLYKALECQYIKTLMSLHKHFPVVKVDLVLRHSWMGNKSVGQIERTLASVDRACVEWTRRAALACVPDLEQLCRDNLHEPQDWELNFKACKAYGQAVAKMTFEDEKIDWLSVGTATLRREFESQARNLWACLISSLQVSCRDDAASIDSFIANATLALENRALPKNAKELGDISAKQQVLKEKMPEMERTVESLKKKGHMLRTWGGDPSVDSTIKEWQKIHELMVSHQQMFEHQAEIVKSSLSGEWDNLNTSLESWLSRWSQARQRFDVTSGVDYDQMMERCRLVFDAEAQWVKFAGDRDDLLKECEKFNMTPNVTDTWKEAENIISEDIQLWSPLKDYDEEYEALSEQEWIVFHKKLHLIDELVSKWTSRLEPYTHVTLFLQQQLDKYNELTPLLKYLRGTDFTERHWREVFSLLEMEYKRPDTLRVKDLLTAALNIKKHIKALQRISSAASSESAIRAALNDLELWFAGARLTIIYYTDKGGQATPIVKDFKTIMSKIEEQQWVVSGVRGGAGGEGGAGGDASAAWDMRLRTAHQLLRSTHHAQRRLV